MFERTADSEDLARVATPSTLDEIVTISLALRFGDGQFAEEVFRDIHDQAIVSRERFCDASTAINLSSSHPGASYFSTDGSGRFDPLT